MFLKKALPLVLLLLVAGTASKSFAFSCSKHECNYRWVYTSSGSCADACLYSYDDYGGFGIIQGGCADRNDPDGLTAVVCACDNKCLLPFGGSDPRNCWSYVEEVFTSRDLYNTSVDGPFETIRFTPGGAPLSACVNISSAAGFAFEAWMSYRGARMSSTTVSSSLLGDNTTAVVNFHDFLEASRYWILGILVFAFFVLGMRSVK